ncbi:hypothetical protein CSW08_13585 [Confluentibacter flavum]|uniref:Uncharacterized protein n=1 Tax=Confluentibacter flavum TaxID=1909700 RepID=A0A2N3HHZ8_9FLAO|nr:hypothetical protein CSW08_13585 [Confluentibacter flavum]
MENNDLKRAFFHLVLLLGLICNKWLSRYSFKSWNLAYLVTETTAQIFLGVKMGRTKIGKERIFMVVCFLSDGSVI